MWKAQFYIETRALSDAVLPDINGVGTGLSNGHLMFLTFRFCLFLRGSSSMLVNKFLAAANSLKSGIRSSAKSRVTISPEKLLLAPKSASSLRNQKSRDMTMNDDESDVSDADSDVSIETAVTKYGINLTGIILPIILYS